MIALVCVISLAIILEPRFMINGYATLDCNRLSVYEQTAQFIDEDSRLIDGQKRLSKSLHTDIQSLPSFVPNAFIAIEDKRFYSHKGIDFIRIIAAAKNNFLSGTFKEGASTISQQLIKNTHLKNEKTISRKIQEIRMARELERKYTKPQILSMYLNMLYFGDGIYGIENASRSFYNKKSKDLTLAESALLAGIINNPSYYSPRRNYDRAIARKNSVLKRMLEQKLINFEEYSNGISEDIEINNDKKWSDLYCDEVLSEIERKVGKDKYEVFSNGYTIETYLDSELQKFVEELIKNNEVCGSYTGIMVSRNSDRAIIAAGCNSTTDVSNFKRQPGSTIKPFLYAYAMEKTDTYSCTPILDEKTDFNGWSPSNYNERYFGWTDVENSLIHSLNVPAVKILEQNGIDKSKRFLARFGLKLTQKDDSLSLALGCTASGVLLKDLCSSYSVFPNDGLFGECKFIKKIVDQNGNTVYSATNNEYRVISEQCAYMITDILKKCAQRGTAKCVGYSKLPVAAKTGTVGTNEGNTDAYCVCYSPKHTIVVWMGSDRDLMPNEYSGGTLTAKIARKIIEKLNVKDDFNMPSGLVYADIDEETRSRLHRVVLAGNGIPLKNRKTVLFNEKNMPRVYSQSATYLENDSVLDDFNDFEIIDGFLD